MTKLAAFKTTTTESSKQEKVRQAKRTFLVSLFDLTWRLLGAMLLPLFAGLYIDSQRGQGQQFAYIGFFIGIVLGALVLRNVVKKLAKNV